MTEELQTQPQPQAAPPMQPQPKPRLGPQDYRNSELVTKLMAANPPYLYSPAVGPHNFFFSEMLRSLVANKRNESLRNATEQLHHQQQQQQQQQPQQPQQQQPIQHPNHLTSNQLALQAASTRRPRKRSWSQHRYYPDALKDGKDADDRRPAQPEKPLELTNKLSSSSSAFTRSISSTTGAPKYPDGLDGGPSEGFKAPSFHDRKPHDTKPPTAAGVPDKAPISSSSLLQEPPAASMPPSDLILPPPPPVWYPPLYPPYGIDPLHFFIDLRVSGHIYDRKKESGSSSNSSEDSVLTVKREHSKLIGAGNDRQGSAFSVPKPRDATIGNKPAPINLTAPPEEGEGVPGDGYGGKDGTDQQPPTMGSLFLGDAGDHKTIDAIKSTNYVLQNLPRIYGDLNGNHKLVDRCLTEDDETNGNLSDEQEQDSKSVGSADDLNGEENKYKDVDLNVISDEESIAVDEN
ncbi:uncharacterized protein LOC121590295 [Anopheles merus]|uniref:uncharacterized protein LOC121590295 n=1 Tax=Anopheles merus TaxID=30066 RepID=UPI001BE4C162|nr:uncharacterized protein LOC121590295 [Anopheles merus]XP_041765745.1 uncharacterized protein LOC121590295 [Anopheles merus]